MEKLTPKQIRMVNGMTQKQVAEAMGIHLQTYITKECGDRDFTWKEISTFAEIMKVEISRITPIYSK